MVRMKPFEKIFRLTHAMLYNTETKTKKVCLCGARATAAIALRKPI